jgi:hypothetical protein
MKLSPKFDQALQYAVAIHREQIRKGTEIPYTALLLGMANIALSDHVPEISKLNGERIGGRKTTFTARYAAGLPGDRLTRFFRAWCPRCVEATAASTISINKRKTWLTESVFGKTLARSGSIKTRLVPARACS